MANRKRKPYKTMSIRQQNELVLKIQNGMSCAHASKCYGIAKSTIYGILKRKGKIMSACKKLKDSVTLKRKSLHCAKESELESRLYEWFNLKRAQGMAISGPLVITKAKSLKTEMNIKSDIQFSEGWLTRFKNRHCIRQIRITGESCSADSQGANKFSKSFEDVINEYQLTRDQIYNADETGLYWKCLPNKTLAGTEEKSAKGFKAQKERLTVMVCANASGSHRLRLLMIGKSCRPRALKDIINLPVLYRSQKCMDE